MVSVNKGTNDVTFVLNDSSAAQQRLVPNSPQDPRHLGQDAAESLGRQNVVRIVVSQQLNVVLAREGDQFGRYDTASLQVHLDGFWLHSCSPVEVDKRLGFYVADTQTIGVILVHQTLHGTPQGPGLFRAYLGGPGYQQKVRPRSSDLFESCKRDMWSMTRKALFLGNLYLH